MWDFFCNKLNYKVSYRQIHIYIDYGRERFPLPGNIHDVGLNVTQGKVIFCVCEKEPFLLVE